MKNLIIAIILMLLMSCGSQKLVGSDVRDSVRIEIVERKVEVRDTVEVEIPKIVEVAKICQDSSRLANKYAVSLAQVLPSGELYHSLETIPQVIEKPVEVEATVRDSIVYRDRELREVVKVPRELTKWQRFQMSGFWVLAIILIAIIYGKATMMFG